MLFVWFIYVPVFKNFQFYCIFFHISRAGASWVAYFPPLIPFWWHPSSCAVYKWQINLFITYYHYNSQCFPPLLFPWISAWRLRGSLHTWKPCKVAVQSTFEQCMYDIFQYKNKHSVFVFPNLEPIVGTCLYTELCWLINILANIKLTDRDPVTSITKIGHFWEAYFLICSRSLSLFHLQFNENWNNILLIIQASFYLVVHSGCTEILNYISWM